jgi:hypothetical protein
MRSVVDSQPALDPALDETLNQNLIFEMKDIASGVAAAVVIFMQQKYFLE